MKININLYKIAFVLIISSMLFTVSCNDFVEEGYRIDYDESSMSLTVEALTFESAAVGDTISYRIILNSNSNIKSCIVQSTNDGASGSGFDVSDPNYDDPFADHSYGTIKSNIKSVNVKYNFIIPKDIGQSRITFSAIDDEGIASVEKKLVVVPSIAKYSDISLYAKDDLYNDAFSSSNGLVYEDIKTNYSSFTDLNIGVQELIDFIFFVNSSNTAVIASISSSDVSLSLDIENNTILKRIDISNEEFNSLTPASLIELTKNDSIYYTGGSEISNIQVGDIIGFITDLNGVEPLKTGVIKVNGIHPTVISRYEGKSYVMECDVVTQVKN